MVKYEVFPNPDGAGYLLDVQADLLDVLNTRIVVPLMPRGKAPKPAKRLNPVFEIEGEQVVMLPQFMAAVPVAILKTPTANLAGQFDQIANALDMVFVGF